MVAHVTQGNAGRPTRKPEPSSAGIGTLLPQGRATDELVASALDALVDDAGRASFPASDPPSSWSGVGDPAPAR